MKNQITINTEYKVGQTVFSVYPSAIGDFKVKGYTLTSSDDLKVVVTDSRGNTYDYKECNLYETWQEAFDVLVENMRKKYEKEYDDDDK